MSRSRNLSAAADDISHPNWRSSATIGIYRFWNNLGYGIGALGLGIAAHFSGSVEAVLVRCDLDVLSGTILWLFVEETHSLINPATP
ncbi:MAG: hypothetical protein WA635_12520 [Gallionella sp.]